MTWADRDNTIITMPQSPIPIIQAPILHQWEFVFVCGRRGHGCGRASDLNAGHKSLPVGIVWAGGLGS